MCDGENANCIRRVAKYHEIRKVMQHREAD